MIKLLNILKELKIKPDYGVLQIYKTNNNYDSWNYTSDLMNFRTFRIIGEIENDSMFRLFPDEINEGDLYLGIVYSYEIDFLEILEKNNIFFKIIRFPTTNEKGVIIPKGHYEIINKEDINELKIQPDNRGILHMYHAYNNEYRIKELNEVTDWSVWSLANEDDENDPELQEYGFEAGDLYNSFYYTGNEKLVIRILNDENIEYKKINHLIIISHRSLVEVEPPEIDGKVSYLDELKIQPHIPKLKIKQIEDSDTYLTYINNKEVWLFINEDYEDYLSNETRTDAENLEHFLNKYSIPYKYYEEDDGSHDPKFLLIHLDNCEIVNDIEDINELKIKPDVPKLDAYFDGHYGYEIPKIDSNNNLWLFEKEDNLFFFMLDYNSLNNEDDHSELLKILNNIKTDLDKYKVDYKIDQINDWTYFIYINADNINIIEK